MYYEEQQRLGYLQYEELFYDLLSRVVCNQRHIDDNKDYYDHIVFKTYERYAHSKTEEYSIRQIVMIFEITLDALFKYKPSDELLEDVITIT